MIERPMVNVYEPDEEGVEQLVYRQMNDDEFVVWQADVEAAANRPIPENPVIAAVKALSDDEKKELLAALGVN